MNTIIFRNTVFTAILLASLMAFAQMDSPPEPYGGQQWMKEFICNEMDYPEEAIRNKTEGTVEVGLTVLQDGNTANYRILKSISPELDREALRICRLILFYPAVASGNRIIEDVKIPVRFHIKKYKRNCKKKGYNDFDAYEGLVDSSLKVYPTSALDHAPRPVFSDPGMSFGKYIAENLKYPATAYAQNISGEVKLSFIVETSGRISNLEVVDPLGGGCTGEAIILLMKVHWRPGILKDKAVRSFQSATINFSLGNESEHHYLPNNNNSSL
jgi:TonB family protein